jgi:23S rRNA pseudouridine2605 synthase
VDIEERVYPVGRLDFYSEGLILLTNDGELTNRLTHPRFQHEKEYRVKVVKRPDKEQIEKWRRGVILEDGYRTQRAEVEISSYDKNGAWLNITLREGKKRQIRLTGKTIGLPVERIIRIRIANLVLGNLKPKKWRYLNRKEIHNLKNFKS